jgi:tetratricopeptide (TPR) repeat protein
MTDSNVSYPSLRDRYYATIDDLVELILTGKQIISQEYIYRVLAENIIPGTSEIIEGCLDERMQLSQHESESQSNAVKHSKIGHKIGTLKLIKTVLSRWQADRQSQLAVERNVESIIQGDPIERLSILLGLLDRNRTDFLSLTQIKLIGKALESAPEIYPDVASPEQLEQLAMGIERGSISLNNLEPHLVSWLYEGNSQIGFGDKLDRSPWQIWSKYLTNPFVRELFQTIAQGRSIEDAIAINAGSYWDDWIELALILQGLQSGLSSWCAKQMYDMNWGKQMSVSIPITFAGIWCEIANGLNNAVKLNSASRSMLANACFEITTQLLFTTAQQPNFPLYGSIFASFSGRSLQATLSYFDRPLKQVDGTQEKGRLLTILGYSQQVLGQVDRAVEMHREAMEIAIQSGDTICEIANLNHLARIAIGQKGYDVAIDLSQRALICARQTGDKMGEANALINYGYSNVISAHDLERMTADISEVNITYLEQGIKIARTLTDDLSIALGCYSLGLAYLTIDRPEDAIGHLQLGLKAAQDVGNLYLQGLNLLYLAEAHYSWEKYKTAVYYGCLAMYLLHQIEATEKQQVVNLISIIRGRQGNDWFDNLLTEYRDRLVTIIGVEGWDYLPQLWG